MVTSLLASEPAYLGDGVWLARAQAAQTGWVLATPSSALSAGNLPVSALLLLCAADSSHLPQLDNLAKLAAAGQLATLAGSDGVSILQAGPASGLSETFTIINPHGLHARPGAMLVKVAKEYASDIRVANLDGSGEAVSAKSLMKVIGLGVKCGHRLAFRAEGADAEAALKGIGEAIAAGLGEGALS
ncbi:Multiphosphoryl transfer protein [compost metagenome]